MKTALLTFCLGIVALFSAGSAKAQQTEVVSRQMVSPGIEFFVPNWQVDLQLGGAYDLGEAKFGHLISPALQVSTTYQFHRSLAARFGLSGLWARNRYAYPEARYQWNFVQPALDLKADLTSLILGWNPERLISAYAFLGAGVAFSFNNGDAVEADKRFGIDFQKLWDDHRWNPVIRGGVGAELHMNEQMALTAEVNANMLPDHFNSKLGRNDNRDWHFNALVGLKLNLGKTHGRTEPIYRDIVRYIEQPEPNVITEMRDTVAMTVYVQFELNKSIIRSREYQKLVRLAQYLNDHPTAGVELTGYADKDTGTPTINDRLSRERATAVAQFLTDRGIESSRISKFAKGDRVQPFQIPEDNRVTICIVTDKVKVTRTEW